MLYYIILLHWIGDFVCQVRWMAVNKSTNQLALLTHGLTYGLILAIGLFVIPQFAALEMLVLFLVLNTSAHTLTDMITSKMTSFLYKKGQMYLFFMVIGFDQMIHMMTLLLSYQVFLTKV